MENLDTPIAPEPQPIGYVTYDDAGTLTGSFLQILQPEHADNHIVIDDALRLSWNAYRANEARDGLELAPPAPPLAAAVPPDVTRRQGLHALFEKHGITELMVEAKIVEIIHNPGAQYLALVEFRASTVFERYRDLVIMMGAAFDLDLDALFIHAKTL